MFTVKIQNEHETIVQLFSYKSVLFLSDKEDLVRSFLLTDESEEVDGKTPEMPYWGKVVDIGSNDPNDCYWLASGDSLYVTDMSGKTVLIEKYIEIAGGGYDVVIDDSAE